MSKEISQEPLPRASLSTAAPRPNRIPWGQGRLVAVAGPPSVAPLVPVRQETLIQRPALEWLHREGRQEKCPKKRALSGEAEGSHSHSGVLGQSAQVRALQPRKGAVYCLGGSATTSPKPSLYADSLASYLSPPTAEIPSAMALTIQRATQSCLTHFLRQRA